MCGKLWHEGGNKSLRHILGVGLDVGEIIFHQLCDGGRVLWDCAVLGKVCHCKSHHNLFGSRACNPSPGNHYTEEPSLAIPATTSFYPIWEKWTLDPLLFYALSVNSRTMDCQTLPSVAPASVGLTASPPMEAMALLLWALHGHHCLVGLGPSFGHCLHWSYYTLKKQRTCVGYEAETRAM